MKRSFKFLFGRLLAQPASPEAPPAGRKPAAPAKKAVWRISTDTPQGQWVAASAAPATTTRKKRSEDSVTDWTTSSMDLLNGTDVVEHTMGNPPDAGSSTAAAKTKAKRPRN